MNVKEIDNTKVANSTRDNMYKIHFNKYIEHDPSKPITTGMSRKETNTYKNAHIQVVTIEFLESGE